MFFIVMLLGVVVNHLDSTPLSYTEAQSYLASFGYLHPRYKNTSNSIISGYFFELAVKNFQSFFGLNLTGELDEETKKEMRKPRCGHPDQIIPEDSSTQRKRNINNKGNRWTKNELTYGIRKYTPDLEKSVVDREIAKAFQLWEEVTPLTFTFVETGNVDIEISFESGAHSDSRNHDAFHGPGTTYAHAAFPPSGDTHFNDAETWTISSDGINLFQVATHEFGHALGLAHFESKTDVMFAYYDYRLNFKLEPNDINRIQQLYGINNKWLKKKLDEITTDVKNLKIKLEETKKELDGAKNTIAKLETNGHTNVKSTAFYFYVQRNSPFNEDKIAIPFDVARVNNGNAMDFSSGEFLAPKSGIYFFSFTGLASFPETKSPNKVQLEIGLYLSGKRVGRALAEESNTVANQKCPLSLQSTLKLEKHDNLWLQIDFKSTPEVFLYDEAGPGRDGHWTHFTGWMLQEEILE
ncbi:hypothetical protein DAPPUDRAFT_325673 [Daphnia pulex]|uniref:C1q domain-containing protein n=1 Tax=Daphnia pulex TaxID=6669 RepID=E9H5Q1_DAPPU|nr:hypothetical protein DAPPUDRAFT_325673 [Daphnia pulex]|eukprot:EFX73049.1 hypothetical protein DAPPUDRAFT_325673 [Daphnia pulex]